MATTEEISVDSLNAYLRYFFVTRYNCLCFISMFTLILLQRAAQRSEYILHAMCSY